MSTMLYLHRNNNFQGSITPQGNHNININIINENINTPYIYLFKNLGIGFFDILVINKSSVLR